MKYRIRKTGEVVDVISYSHVLGTTRSWDDKVSYIDSKGIEHHLEEGLNVYWDFEPVEDKHQDIYWNKIRIQAAMYAMQGLNASPFFSKNETPENLARKAVEQANSLVVELKKQIV